MASHSSSPFSSGLRRSGKWNLKSIAATEHKWSGDKLCFCGASTVLSMKREAQAIRSRGLQKEEHARSATLGTNRTGILRRKPELSSLAIGQTLNHFHPAKCQRLVVAMRLEHLSPGPGRKPNSYRIR